MPKKEGVQVRQKQAFLDNFASKPVFKNTLCEGKMHISQIFSLGEGGTYGNVLLGF